MKYITLLLVILIFNCSLQKRTKKTVIQGEEGSLELKISSNFDTISQNEIENLRIDISLKSNYPFTVQSAKYINFVECEIFRNGIYFHTVDKAVGKKLEYLEPMFTQLFHPDSTVSTILYLNLPEICKKKSLPLEGLYKFQGYYDNTLINENDNVPVWIGSITSNNKFIVVN